MIWNAGSRVTSTMGAVVMGRGARASVLLCLAGAAAVLLVAPPPAAVDRAAAVTVAELAAPGRAGLPAEPDQPAPPEGQCTDGTATWLGTRWREPVHWRLRTADVPDYLGSPDAT